MNSGEQFGPRPGFNARRKVSAVVSVLAAVLALTAFSLSPTAWGDPNGVAPYVVSGYDGTAVSDLAAVVSAVGGQAVTDLGSGSVVSADLTSEQVVTLDQEGLVVTPNIQIGLQGGFGSDVSSTRSPAAVFPQQTGATSLWARGDKGSGANVAVLDTGIDPLPDFAGRLVGGVDLSGGNNPFQDDYGHGTFVAGLIAGNGASSGGTYMGEAPGAGLVSVKVAGASGNTDLATVISGVDWVTQHASSLNIDVLNMSLGFIGSESTLVNPLDQAVQRAWEAGVVVVASAGNAGPANGTILSPGDDPLVITVGAVDDLGQTNPANDQMSTFSSAGPTDPDGWIKPDVVTSGQSVVSVRAPGSTVDAQNPSAIIGTGNFVGSGTSFSSAIAAGAAALIISDNHNVQPDDVKARLLATASQGPVGNPYVDGHGILNVAAANQDNGVHLKQSFGEVTVPGKPIGNLSIQPGDTIAAGYSLTMPGNHPAASVSLLGGTVSLPITCSRDPKSPSVGWITVGLFNGPYSIAAGYNQPFPTNDPNSPASYQGSTVAPDLCSGQAMYAPIPATYTGEVVSSDQTDRIQVKLHYTNLSQNQKADWGPQATVIPVVVTAEGSSVDTTQPWTQSSWNMQNWGGLAAPKPPPPGTPATSTTTVSTNGVAWDGEAWNGRAWSGVAWDGRAWSGVAWDGRAWSGRAWNGRAWSGVAWDGSDWDGIAWSGGSWS